jgi:hypothetical protein
LCIRLTPRETPVQPRVSLAQEVYWRKVALADLLSRALVAERNITPYGRDSRWHCHLYPIFLAEEAIKNGFYSKDVLMGMIRWPRLPQPIA